jgi:two-component system cell cycle response regulator
LIGRYGGEEFLLVLPSCTVQEVAQVAERLRIDVATTPVTMSDSEVSVTASFGVAAAYSPQDEEIDSLLRIADMALYQAKKAGRNRVVLGSAIEETRTQTPNLFSSTTF